MQRNIKNKTTWVAWKLKPFGVSYFIHIRFKIHKAKIDWSVYIFNILHKGLTADKDCEKLVFGIHGGRRVEADGGGAHLLVTFWHK